jgi:hypothetical protein
MVSYKEFGKILIRIRGLNEEEKRMKIKGLFWCT